MRFLGGFITGVVTTVLVLLIIYFLKINDSEPIKANENLLGLTIFPNKGECITKSQLVIFQTLKPNMALAKFGHIPDEVLGDGKQSIPYNLTFTFSKDSLI